MTVYPADSTDDHWHLAVKLLTGYQAPLRDSLFDKLLGNQKIPLMKVEFSDFDGEPSNAILEAIDDMDWRVQNSGWRIENTDFVVPFFSGKHGPITSASVGTKVVMKKARVTLLGTRGTDVPSGGWGEGGEIVSGMDKPFDDLEAHQTWNDQALHQYSYGGGKALQQLLGFTGSTVDFSFNGISVERKNAVSLKSFEEAAQAFDRAAYYFAARHNDLADWEFDLGTEQTAWKGQAAGVFYDLVHGLNRNYREYSEQLPFAGILGSKYGIELRGYATALRNAAQDLYNAWDSWQWFEGNPLRWLHDVLLDVTDYMWYHNLTKVRYKSNGRGGGDHKVKFDGFNGGYEDWGALEDKATWKKIGEEAIRRWQNSVKKELGATGRQALIDIQNSWNDESFKPITTVNIDLKQHYADDKQTQEEEEQKRKEKEAEEKQEKKEKEAEQKQKEAEEKQEKKEKEAELRQEQKEKEAEEKQEKKEKEAEEKQEKKEKEAEQKQKEAEEKQEKKEQEAEQKQAEQEKKQAELQAQQEAKQEQQEKEAEQKQAEQEAKQEELQAQQEAKQEQQEKEAEQKQAEQEKKQEQQQEEMQAQQTAMFQLQQKEQAEQQRKADEKQAQQEAKQEQKEQEAEQKQAEQEAKQEELQAQQEAKQA
ncbi:AAWKG family protein, partial [Streptomyces sp. NPDC007084]|uniref:AAWKG family protein n=1 Tax=Streptomyces sp. NPDC007084 TaxID=3154313 RepID=UPI0034562581